MIFVLIIAIVSSLNALADVSKSTMISLNTIYLDRDYNDNGVASQSKITDTDIRVMRVEKQWSYGAIYAISSNDASNADRTSYGVSAGYYSEKDFYVNAHYFFSSKYSFGGAGNQYTKGSGYELDLGFLSKVTSSFYVGLLVGIKDFKYTEQTVGGVTSSVTATHHEVLPMFTFAVSLM